MSFEKNRRQCIILNSLKTIQNPFKTIQKHAESCKEFFTIFFKFNQREFTFLQFFSVKKSVFFYVFVIFDTYALLIIDVETAVTFFSILYGSLYANEIG